jgi:Fur family ferric uptake transcriptional regulator
VVELQECDLEPWLERVAGAHGFEQLDHRLEVTGLCADCRSAPFGRPAIMDRL